MKENNENKKKCFSMVSNYGLMVCQQVVNTLSNEEDYERAAILYSEMKWFCERLNMQMPDVNFEMEDYKAEFWKMGHSAEIASKAFDTYYKYCLQDVKELNIN